MKTGRIVLPVSVCVMLQLLLTIALFFPSTNTAYASSVPSAAPTTTEAQANPPASQAPDSGPSQSAPKYTKEQLEEFKEQNERAAAMNVLIQQAQTAISAKNWKDAVSPLQQLVAMDPNGWPFYSSLGDAQLNLGQYEQAIETYERGIQAAERTSAVDPTNPSGNTAAKKAGTAKMLTNTGNAYLKLRKNDEAVAAYTKAAAMEPNPAKAYFNLCATQYNIGNTEGALNACGKAIAADPNKADAYFIKGSALMAESTVTKDGKTLAPAGTVEALKKYLQLAPNGGHVADVRQMLDYLDGKSEADGDSQKSKSKAQ
jgi:tetratricopeptide (TPR) repeat protein